jgi:hypothetical protein
VSGLPYYRTPLVCDPDAIVGLARGGIATTKKIWMCVLFYFCFVCLHVYAYAFKSNAHRGSALGPDDSGLPYYCTPLVCIPDLVT